MVIFHNELLVSTEVIDESTEVIKKNWWFLYWNDQFLWISWDHLLIISAHWSQDIHLLSLDCWNQVGLSENSVPLHPMVNDHYPY